MKYSYPQMLFYCWTGFPCKRPILYSQQLSTSVINLSREAVRILYENRNVLYPLFLSFTVCYFEHKPQCKITLGIHPHPDSVTTTTMVSTIDAEHAGLLFLAFLVSWAPSFMILFISKDSMDAKLFRHTHFFFFL